ncbi:MAG: hypothetical protein Q4B69_02525, partial [Slackia sp.]|nr:hypothetical protein [Slackia sp.]
SIMQPSRGQSNAKSHRMHYFDNICYFIHTPSLHLRCAVFAENVSAIFSQLCHKSTMRREDQGSITWENQKIRPIPIHHSHAYTQNRGTTPKN